MDYANFVSTAVAIKGYQQENGVLHLTRTVRDIDNDCTKAYFIPYDSKMTPLCSPVEVVKSDVAASSPSGNRLVRMAFSDEKCLIEVFVCGVLTLRVDGSEAHGRPIGDSWFGGYSFSKDEERLVYVAGIHHSVSSPPSPSCLMPIRRSTQKAKNSFLF